jgi:predicted DNA-binding transcriptional regulator AlpA
VFRDEMLSEYVGGVCYVTVWRWMKADKFPLPYLVGDTNAWDEAELLAWQQSCPRRGYHKSEVA